MTSNVASLEKSQKNTEEGQKGLASSLSSLEKAHQTTRDHLIGFQESQGKTNSNLEKMLSQLVTAQNQIASNVDLLANRPQSSAGPTPTPSARAPGTSPFQTPIQSPRVALAGLSLENGTAHDEVKKRLDNIFKNAEGKPETAASETASVEPSFRHNGVGEVQATKLPKNIQIERIQRLVNVVPNVTPSMHEAFCAIVKLEPEKLNFIEWGLESDRVLTLPQYWNKLMSLYTIDQWRKCLQKVATEQNLDIETHIESVSGSGPAPKWDILDIFLNHVVDPLTLGIRSP